MRSLTSFQEVLICSKPSARDELKIIAGPPMADQRSEWTDQGKTRDMSNTFGNFALQLAATLSLSGLVGAALFFFADYATSGVIV